MSWIERFFRRESDPVATGAAPPARPVLREEIGRTHRKMATSLVATLQARDPDLGIVEHSALVSMVAGLIGKRIGVSETEDFLLTTAAQLHELGMLSVPAELLQRPAPLSGAELERVRAQAEVSAELARATQHPRVARLIRHQYDDYRQLRMRADVPAKDLLLAGIFRVADVIAAVTWPRPYQDPMPAERRAEVLQSGAGTQFHPLAVHFALQVWGRG